MGGINFYKSLAGAALAGVLLFQQAPALTMLHHSMKPVEVKYEESTSSSWQSSLRQEMGFLPSKQEFFSQLEGICVSGGFFDRIAIVTHLPILRLNNRDYYLIGQEPHEDYRFVPLQTYNDYAGDNAVQIQVGLVGDYNETLKLSRERALKEILYEFFMEHDFFDILLIKTYHTDKEFSLADGHLSERMHIQFKTYNLPQSE